MSPSITECHKVLPKSLSSDGAVFNCPPCLTTVHGPKLPLFPSFSLSLSSPCCRNVRLHIWPFQKKTKVNGIAHRQTLMNSFSRLLACREGSLPLKDLPHLHACKQINNKMRPHVWISDVYLQSSQGPSQCLQVRTTQARSVQPL